MANSLLGKDFTPADVRAKVTGRAKFAEDSRVWVGQLILAVAGGN